MRRVLAMILLAATAALPASGGVHEKFKIVGAVVKVHAEQLDVKGVDGSIYEMDFFDAAPVFRRGAKVGRGALKAGMKVTVNALGHDFFDLEVVDVHVNE